MQEYFLNIFIFRWFSVSTQEPFFVERWDLARYCEIYCLIFFSVLPINKVIDILLGLFKADVHNYTRYRVASLRQTYIMIFLVNDVANKIHIKILDIFSYHNFRTLHFTTKSSWNIKIFFSLLWQRIDIMVVFFRLLSVWPI